MAEVAVLVPVMLRPRNAEPFVASLRDTAGVRAAVYAVADTGDTETVQAWRRAGADGVFDGEWGTFARKVNAGYRLTREPWLFLAGDDVRFHPAWLYRALSAAAAVNANVVGTNDLGNARVVAGEHATHMLVRRSYVDEVGASWDGPGVVCHEGYAHNYVDDELVTAAKQRGVWTSAWDAVVEHRHPLWCADVPVDRVYEVGRLSAARDRQLFESRRARYAPAGV